MKKAIIIIIFLVLCLYTAFACSVSSKEIIGLTGCKDNEVVSDIEYSLENLSDYAESNKINISFDEASTECGYILKDGSKSKNIRSAMTDIDLIYICKEFFNTSDGIKGDKGENKEIVDKVEEKREKWQGAAFHSSLID